MVGSLDRVLGRPDRPRAGRYAERESTAAAHHRRSRHMPNSEVGPVFVPHTLIPGRYVSGSRPPDARSLIHCSTPGAKNGGGSPSATFRRGDVEGSSATIPHHTDRLGSWIRGIYTTVLSFLDCGSLYRQAVCGSSPCRFCGAILFTIGQTTPTTPSRSPASRTRRVCQVYRSIAPRGGRSCPGRTIGISLPRWQIVMPSDTT